MPSVASEVGTIAASHTAHRAHKGTAKSDHDAASPFAMLLDTGSSVDASAKTATDSQSARPMRSVQAGGGASTDRSADPTQPATSNGQPQTTNSLADKSDPVASGQVASGHVTANTISTSTDGKVTEAIADDITTAQGSSEDQHSADKTPDGGDALAVGATPPPSSPPPDVAPTIVAVAAVPAVIDAPSGQPTGAAAGIEAAPISPTAPGVVPDPAQQSAQQAPQPLSTKPSGQMPAVQDTPPTPGIISAADQPPPAPKSDPPHKADGAHPTSVDTATTAPQSTGVAATQPADDVNGPDTDQHDDVKDSTPHAVAGNGLEEATEPTKAIHRQPKAEPTAEQNEAGAVAKTPTVANSLQPIDLQSVRIRVDGAIPAAQTVTLAVPTAASVAVPVNGLAVEIAAHAQEGQNRFEIRLDPPELGRIEVRLDVDRDGNVSTRVMVDRAETLDALRREAPQLQQALDQAGLKTGSNGLQFSLRDQSFAGTGQNNRHNALPHAARIIVPDDEMTAVEATRGYSRWAGLGGGVDIRV